MTELVNPRIALGAGRVTHMFEIVETLNAAVKVVTVG
jgi:hypothetical protein